MLSKQNVTKNGLTCGQTKQSLDLRIKNCCGDKKDIRMPLKIVGGGAVRLVCCLKAIM